MVGTRTLDIPRGHTKNQRRQIRQETTARPVRRRITFRRHDPLVSSAYQELAREISSLNEKLDDLITQAMRDQFTDPSKNLVERRLQKVRRALVKAELLLSHDETDVGD